MLMAVLSMQTYVLSPLLTLSLLLVLHPLYFWSFNKPMAFPAWLAFLLGVAIDLVSGKLLGLNAFLLVFLSVIISHQRRYLLSQPFATQWAGFLFVCLAAEGLRWLVMVVVTLTLFSPASALVSAILCAALYPLSALVMRGCLRVISPDQSSESLQD